MLKNPSFELWQERHRPRPAACALQKLGAKACGFPRTHSIKIPVINARGHSLPLKLSFTKEKTKNYTLEGLADTRDIEL